MQHPPIGPPRITSLIHLSVRWYYSFLLNATDYDLSNTGGRIDHGHHAGIAVRALHDAVAMNKAVSKALQMINQGNFIMT